MKINYIIEINNFNNNEDTITAFTSWNECEYYYKRMEETEERENITIKIISLNTMSIVRKHIF